MKRRVCENSFTGKTLPNVVLVESSAEPLGQPLVNSYAVHKNSSIDLIELAKEIQKADSFITATTCSKLHVIAEQMKLLRNQAQNVLIEAKRDDHLHHVACNLQKVPGKVYHLYKRESGQEFFSLISPEEWGSSLCHEHLGSYRLEFDMSWTPEDLRVEKQKGRNENVRLLRKVLETENYETSPIGGPEQMMIDFE